MSILGKSISRLQRKVFNWRRETGWRMGLSRSFYVKAKGSRILVYHGVCKHDHLRYNTLFLTEKMMEEQFRLFKEYFNTVSLDSYCKNEYDSGKFTITLTFDDGFANNLKYVLPLLEKYELPATFFITGIRSAGYNILWNDYLAIARKIGPAEFQFNGDTFIRAKYSYYYSKKSGERLDDILRRNSFALKAELMKTLGDIQNSADVDYWLQLTEEEIITLSRNRWVTIGNHSFYHNDLTQMPAQELTTDLNASKKFLESLVGKNVNAIAFPYGSYNKEVIELALEAGHTQLFGAGAPGVPLADEPYFKDRLIINPYISSINQMHATITGRYS